MRASARPPWRTLLLALLLAAGCTTAPASRESATGTTTAPAVRQPAAGSTLATLAPVKLSGVVRLEPGLSGGLVTVVGLTGQSRPEPGGGRTQLAVRVTGEDWVGKLPTRVWVPGPLDPGGTSCQDCANYFGFQEKGSQWVVTVRDADAKLIDALLVVRGKVRIPPRAAGSCRSPMTSTAATRVWWTWTP